MILKNIRTVIICVSVILYDQFFYHSGASPLFGEEVRLADTDEFPFIVSISYNITNDTKSIKYHECGGSLITQKHVLTVAHCVEGERYDTFLVKVGSIDLQNALIYEINSWVTYNEWVAEDSPTVKNGDIYHDIAIVKLFKSVSSSIPLGIITKHPDKHLYGREVVTAGWGRIAKNEDGNDWPSHLRAVNLTVHHPKNCLFVNIKLDDNADEQSQKEFEVVRKKYTTEKMLCTFADPPVSLGCGDSGGPLMLPNKREIIGVNKGWCALDYDPSQINAQNLHSSIEFYREFIHDVAKPVCIH